MFTAGQIVAGYRIQRVLGTGGMGTVYLAANPTLPRREALKVLSAELSRNPDFRARFIREAEVAARLDHPHIVSVYNRGQTADGQLWIAMQFVDGTDADAAQRSGTMTAQRAVHIVTDVAQALDYAHARGVIHRDVKPANFLLSGTPEADERALLGDFGIARALDDVGLTATGSVLATIAYAAPEALSGAHLDGRADIYSLGCTLFSLLTGRTPFSSANGMAAVMMAHLHQPPPRVSDFLSHLPAALDVVIATAMAKDPAARFPSASALAQAAQAALANQLPAGLHYATPQAPLRSAPERLQDRRLRPRRRAWTLAGGAAAVLLVSGSVAAVTMAGREHPPEPAAAVASEAPAPSTIPLAGPEPHSPLGPASDDVQPAALREILLPADQLRSNSTAHELVLEEDFTTLLDDTAAVTPPDCVGTWAPAQERADGGRGQTGVAVQVLRAMNRRATDEGVVQAVVSYPTHMAAVQSLQRQQRQWQSCAGQSITVAVAGTGPQAWEFGPSEVFAGTVTSAARLRDGTAVCQHGINVRGNVLIDIRQCLPRGGNDVAALVNATGDRVPRQ
ncbi:serine/threonine-protein kinase PknH/PknJ [Mycolicibacter sinensis]|uniref:serine/threonine-protein kinase PknH/PknJ n=1 Tax=Mycolicibacter sinensis (strain JDM601) TaxID=875328 RepID=UPI000A866B79